MPECAGVPPTLILASASPRRAALLEAAGISFEVVIPVVDEAVRAGETAEGYVCRLAEAKAAEVAARCPDRAILAADTTVVVDGGILGKPVDAADARRMLERLSGRTHHVLTGVSLRVPSLGGAHVVDTRAETTAVRFAALGPGEIAWYLATGEGRDKAGGYAVQGFASRFVTHLEGSGSNVVGLPVALVYQMCTGAGLLLS
jgi:septum formation protein